ncbi:hypothetical protein HanRHA438_Chr01g0016201 [Helianthus annuus]|nr:hypothetical protein HanRHA438_Chr01g0016201 [Helianthus annuus]
MFTSNCRRCPFGQKFTGGVLNLSKSCTLCPLGQTWLESLQAVSLTFQNLARYVLRLNLVGSPKKKLEADCPLPSSNKPSENQTKNRNKSLESVRGSAVTPTSSPEVITATEAGTGTSSVSSSDPGTSPFFIPVTNSSLNKDKSLAEEESRDLDLFT